MGDEPKYVESFHARLGPVDRPTPPMTVADLIVALQQLPQDTPVVAEGYDGSCQRVLTVTHEKGWAVVIRTNENEQLFPVQ